MTKICPFMSGFREAIYTNCIENECELWDEKIGRCSLNRICEKICHEIASNK